MTEDTMGCLCVIHMWVCVWRRVLYSKWWCAPFKGDIQHVAKCQGQLCFHVKTSRLCAHMEKMTFQWHSQPRPDPFQSLVEPGFSDIYESFSVFCLCLEETLSEYLQYLVHDRCIPPCIHLLLLQYFIFFIKWTSPSPNQSLSLRSALFLAVDEGNIMEAVSMQ